MLDTARLPNPAAGLSGSPPVLPQSSGRRARLGALLARYRVELAWALFALANYAAMVLWPSWETIPFHFVWISLTLLYGFRVWPLRATLVVLIAVMVITAVSISFDAFEGIQLWGELFEVPLMAAMFLAMVWHARRRVEAQRIAEGRAEEHRSMLERQERFIHDASHELRTPVTIARGHLELVDRTHADAAEVAIALDELQRIDAIVDRLLVLATADQPHFVRPVRFELEPFLEDVFMRWSEVAPRAWRLGPLAAGRLTADAEQIRTALDALIENAVKYSPARSAIELRARREGPGVRIEVEDQGTGIPPAALGPLAVRRRRRARTRHRRRDRQGPRWPMRGEQQPLGIGVRPLSAGVRPHPRAARGQRRIRVACRAHPPAWSAGTSSTAARPANMRPAANTVGVVTTPARTPEWKSRRTRARTASLRRSASKRSRSSPSASARRQR
jgi:signal transduction histidine kinase